MVKNRFLRLLRSLGVLLAVFAASLAILPVLPAAISGQTTTTLPEATTTLSFNLTVEGGIEPILSVVVVGDSYCIEPEGAAISKSESVDIRFITHEAIDSSFGCVHNIYLDFLGFINCTAEVVKSGTKNDLSIASRSPNGIRLLRVEGSGNPSFRTGRGELKAINDRGGDISNGGDLADITVNVDDCEVDELGSSSSFVVGNVEPNQGMSGVFSTVQNCTPPGGAVVEANLEEYGTDYIVLDTSCLWNFDFADARNSCTATAVIYTTGRAAPTFVVGSRRVDQTLELYSTLPTSGRGRGAINYEGSRLQLILLYRSQFCVEVIAATIAIDAPSEFIDESVTIDVFPIGAAASSSCSRFSVGVTPRAPRTIFLILRERLGTSRCRYQFSAPEISGPLQLVASEGSVQNFDVSGGQFYANLEYGSKQIPIQIHSVFPSSQVFTTEDRVGMRLFSEGECSRVTSTFGGLLSAGVGVYRTFQAFPRTTQLLGLDATQVGSNPPYVYTMPPSILVADRFGDTTEQACSVSVTVSSVPFPCEIVGDKTQSVLADGDSESFDFFFIFSCSGVVGTPTDPSEPPSPPDPTDPTDDGDDTVAGESLTIRLEKGWQQFPYNGESGVTPVEFLGTLADRIPSIWKWDAAAQRWLGYREGETSTLKELNNGDVIFMYIPNPVVITLRPGDLLSITGREDEIVLAPRYNLIGYTGITQSPGRAFDSQHVLAIYRWDNDAQDWEYYFPGDSVDSTLQSVRRGDTLFVYSAADFPIRVNY